MSGIFRLVKYAVSTHEERDAAKAAPIVPAFFGRFPTSLGMYYIGDGTDYQSQRFCLCSGTGEKLHALTFHQGLGFRQMTLYPALEFSPPALALASNEKRYSHNALIKIPASSENEGVTFDERMKYRSFANTHVFTATIAAGRAEDFEWREDKQPKPKVRRLMRVGNGEPEVVSVWKEGSVPNRQGRLATLELCGSGATGELGERWALLAVVTALRVCQSEWVALAGSQIHSMEKHISFQTEHTEETINNVPQPFWDYRTSK